MDIKLRNVKHELAVTPINDSHSYITPKQAKQEEDNKNAILNFKTLQDLNAAFFSHKVSFV